MIPWTDAQLSPPQKEPAISLVMRLPPPRILDSFWQRAGLFSHTIFIPLKQNAPQSQP